MVLIATSEDKFYKLACGGSHILLLNDKGQVYSYGNNCKYGQLGLGDVQSIDEPTRISSLGNVVVMEMACGDNHSLLVSQDGNVYSFGNGKYGQLGMEILQYISVFF